MGSRSLSPTGVAAHIEQILIEVTFFSVFVQKTSNTPTLPQKSNLNIYVFLSWIVDTDKDRSRKLWNVRRGDDAGESVWRSKVATSVCLGHFLPTLVPFLLHQSCLSLLASSRDSPPNSELIAMTLSSASSCQIRKLNMRSYCWPFPLQQTCTLRHTSQARPAHDSLDLGLERGVHSSSQGLPVWGSSGRHVVRRDQEKWPHDPAADPYPKVTWDVKNLGLEGQLLHGLPTLYLVKMSFCLQYPVDICSSDHTFYLTKCWWWYFLAFRSWMIISDVLTPNALWFASTQLNY